MRNLVVAVAAMTAGCHHAAGVRYGSPKHVLANNPGTTPVIVVATMYALEEEKPMLARGVTLANAVMATQCFEDYILHSNLTERDPPDRSSEAVWNHLVANQVIVNVAMFEGTWKQNRWWHTVGLEDDAQPGVVQMNRYYVKTAYMVADNLIHEAEGHVQGFRHDRYKPTSVPYTLNAAFEACVGQVNLAIE
jgi:hypothetical protein